jgi:hypothetical protein
MTMVLTELAAPDVAGSPAARFTPLGRAAAAGTVVLGAAFQLAAFLAAPSFDTTSERLDWIADHPDRAELSKLFDVLAMPFLLGTALVYFLLSRDRSRRLAWAAGIVLALGMVGLTAAQGIETLEFALVTDGRFDLAAVGDLVDNISSPPAIAIGVMFLGGVLFGLLLTIVALWRSHAVPRGAVLLIPVFMVTDIALQLPTLAHAIALIGALWIASAVLLAGRGQVQD